jgi:hypothetical protein
MLKPTKDRMRIRFEQAFPDRDEHDYWRFRYYMGIGEIILENPEQPDLSKRVFRKMEVDAFRFLLQVIKKKQ